MKYTGTGFVSFNFLDCLAIIAIFTAGFVTLPYHDGIGLYDSACYVLAAEHFVHGKPIDFSSNIFATRVFTWLPQAAYISWFGLNGSITWVTTLELCFFLTTLYWFLRKQDQTIAFMSVILIGFLHHVLAESSVTLGDILLMGTLNLSVLIAWSSESTPQSNKSLGWKGVMAGFFWIIAFYTKESAVFFLPFFGWLTFKSWQQNKTMIYYWKGFWGMLSLGGIVTMAFSYLLFKDPLWKIHGVENAIAAANEAYGTATFSGILKRWTIWPAEMFAQNFGFGLLTMLAAPFILFKRDQKLVFWLRYAVCIMITWIFCSQKISDYSPIGLIPRLWLPVLPALAIAAAHTVAMIARKQERLRDISIIIIVGAVWLLLDHLSEIEVTSAGRDPFWIKSAFHGFSFVIIGIIGIRILPKIPDVLPSVRPLTLWVVMFPSCYGAINQALSRVTEDNHYSSYDYGREATSYLKDRNPRLIMSSWIYSGSYPIFGVSDLPVIAYGVNDSIAPPETYLLLNKIQINYERSGAQESAFSTELVLRKPLEEHPERFGFKKVWENKIYEIWKN